MTKLTTDNLYHSSILRVNGNNEQLLEQKKPTLEFMQKIVGGYIEVVYGRKNNKDYMMIIDEEGRMNDKPQNYEASKMFVEWLKYHNRTSPILNIVGDVILCNNYELD